jgi:hypothetical protein
MIDNQLFQLQLNASNPTTSYLLLREYNWHKTHPGAINLSEVLQSNIGATLGTEGAVKLYEALQSNSSLTSLVLAGNRLVALFHSS